MGGSHTGAGTARRTPDRHRVEFHGNQCPRAIAFFVFASASWALLALAYSGNVYAAGTAMLLIGVAWISVKSSR